MRKRGLHQAGFFLIGKIWMLSLAFGFLWIGHLRGIDPQIIAVAVNIALGIFVLLTVAFPFWIAKDLKETYGEERIKFSTILDLMLFQWVTWNPKKGLVQFHVGIWSKRAYRMIWDKSGQGAITLLSAREEKKRLAFDDLSLEDRAFIFFLYGFERAFLSKEDKDELYVGVLCDSRGNPKVVMDNGEAHWFLYAAGVEPIYPRNSPKGEFGYFKENELQKMYEAALKEEVFLSLVTLGPEGYEKKTVNPEYLIDNRGEIEGWYEEIRQLGEVNGK